MKEPRSYLFVPGNRPERFAKALAAGADRVVLDLEDAVAADAKAAARDAIADWADGADEALRRRIVVRVNEAASAGFDDDLRLLRAADITALMLPKCSGSAEPLAVRAQLPDARVLALIESAAGVANATGVADVAGVERLVFGTLDFALDLDLDIDADNAPLEHAAAAIAIASRAAGIGAPVAGVTPRIDDADRLLADLAWARRRGYCAKLCIHPKQVAPVHAALAPGAAAVAWARRVIEAERTSPGAAKVDGRMVDRPVVLQAERTLERHNSD